MHRRDVRVIQRRRGPRFLREARQPIRVGRELCRQDLHGHLAAEPSVLGQPHLAHAAGAELVVDLVGTEFCACFHGSPGLRLPSDSSGRSSLASRAATHSVERVALLGRGTRRGQCGRRDRQEAAADDDCSVKR